MSSSYLIQPCSGVCIEVYAGQKITVTDVEGGQVADLFAERLGNPKEFLSPGVTIDCHESLKLNLGDSIYSNLYHPMLRFVRDDVCAHDLLFPSCRAEMYDFFYQNGKGHPNCFDNINASMGECRPIIQPVNLFMNTTIDASGKISIHPPCSKAGDSVELLALMDLRIGIAACSVAESETNAGKCTAIRVTVAE